MLTLPPGAELTFLRTRDLCNSAQLAPPCRAQSVPYWAHCTAPHAAPRHTLYWSYITVLYITCLHSPQVPPSPQHPLGHHRDTKISNSAKRFNCIASYSEFIISLGRLLSEKLSNMILVHLVGNPLSKLQTELPSSILCQEDSIIDSVRRTKVKRYFKVKVER